MNNKRITTKDIAKAAGVSQTAVSFAINGKPGVSSDTRQHIFDIMEKLGAPIKSKGKTGSNIALLFRNDLKELDQLFYSELNTLMFNTCRDRLCNLIMTSVYRDNKGIFFSDIIYSGIIDGILVYGDIKSDVLAELKKTGIPFVVLDSSRSANDHYAVRVDYRTAAFRAATYLINMGHRDIAYIGNHSETLQDFNLLTFSGFQKATSQNNISLGTNRIQLEAHDEDSLQECINKALNGPSRPTALFCTTDYYAILAIRYLHSQGINVPDDISIISIDNLPISKFMTPSLTTVRIDREEIGTRGFELIQKLINQEECESIVIDSYDVIVRESVARIDSGGNTVAS